MADFQMTPSSWSPQREVAVAGRLHAAYLGTPEHLKNYGAQFYPLWNETAQHIGETIGRGTAHGAAILAHLSPSNEAELNRIQGIGLVHTIGEEGHRALIQASQHASQAKSLTSRMNPALKKGRIGEGSKEHTDFLEKIAYHENENAKLRKQSGIIGTPLSGKSSLELGKASEIILGMHNEPLSTLGDVKINDFGHSIFDPLSDRVAIDTHYHDAGLGRTDIPYTAKRGLSSVGRYEHFQTASMMAHSRTLDKLGLSVADLPHNAFMGGIWYGHQQRKVLNNPDARTARKASETRINSIRGNSRLTAFLPETYGLPAAFGKIEH